MIDSFRKERTGADDPMDEVFMNQSDESVTYWIKELKADNSDAAGELWTRYFQRIVGLARKKLGGVPPRVIDAEDVALSVFNSLCLGAAKGNFSILTDRKDLWRLLVTITHQKTVDKIRRANAAKRGGGNVRGDSVFFTRADEASPGFDGCPSDDPDPPFLAMFEDQFQHLLSLLRNDDLRRIALARLEGKTNKEIAGDMEISRRSVERKITLIWEQWEDELNVDGS